MLVGRGSTKRSGSNSRQQQITHTKTRVGGGGGGCVSVTKSSVLFIHLLYLGNVTGSTRNIPALMCCLNAYNKR